MRILVRECLPTVGARFFLLFRSVGKLVLYRNWLRGAGSGALIARKVQNCPIKDEVVLVVLPEEQIFEHTLQICIIWPIFKP
jgi:hypothetical protein